MKMLSRRRFLLSILSAAASAAINFNPKKAVFGSNFSLVVPPPTNRVVHAYHPQAVHWNYFDTPSNWYGDSVSQAIVDNMTDQGIMNLTNTTNITNAWLTLIPSYMSGEKVAIKVNFNNASSCNETDNVIDALPQPVNAIIRGLKLIGIPETGIYIYDVTRGWHMGYIPSRFVLKIKALYPNIQFHSYVDACNSAGGFSSTQRIHFNVPAGRSIPDLAICNTLVNAKYLINMPIMKRHSMAGVTLGFKNHFGSFDHCQDAHWSVAVDDPNYLSSYNAMVDMMKNPNFLNKTVLTVGDGLFGAKINNQNEIPGRWASFNQQSPCSLFFSRDPVAIDCVMYDFLANEGEIPSRSDDYLKLASAQNLGTFEHWDAQKQYHLIDYNRINLNIVLDNKVFLPQARRNPYYYDTD